jgi:DNA repair/transcription protein MET18/MMS19
VVGLLPECLAVLSSGPFADPAALAAVLACMCDILCEEVGRSAAADHAGAIINALSRLAAPDAVASARPPAAVRVVALQGIIAAADLTYSKTYPYRRTLLRVLERAVDDPKKAVRAVAVAARTVWAAMPDN